MDFVINEKPSVFENLVEWTAFFVYLIYFFL